ncbi:hypothetical protein [uncultured Gammaproteobacteria bacterium]|nr:hypothetical protein [uncultured Gammaproteobacteria bacterium]
MEFTKTIVEQAIENLDKMNKIFTLKSPLYIKYPNGETRVIEEIFQHPKGILYFELFWEKDPKYSIHLIEGEITGDGPWRVGKCSFHVLGCNHTHPQMCEMHSFWQQELLQNSDQFRAGDVVKIALEKGAVLPYDYPVNDKRF